MDNDKKRLQLSENDMRKIGYKAVDMLVEHYITLNEKPVTRKSSRDALESSLNENVPLESKSAESVLEELNQHVFNNIMHLDHSRFFAFVPSPSNFISVLGDFLASGFNVFAGTWLESSGPAEIELITINWLRQLFNFSDEAGGLFVSGGSMANLTALATARHVILNDEIGNSTAYFSDQTHSSVEKALKLLGFKEEQIRKLPSDDDFCLSLYKLKEAVNSDRAKGLLPFCIIANAGTTNTGAVDNIFDIANYCRKEKLWLHVDGAYGASAILTDEGKEKLKGINLCDSLSLDPHKWLFQPYDIGCLIVRNRKLLKDTFQVFPEYLRDIKSIGEEINFADYGIELTRSFRALKLWMSLKVFGLEAFKNAVSAGISLARFAETILRGSKCWEIITPAQMGVITFRYIPSDNQIQYDIDEINNMMAKEMMDSGYAMVTTTTLKGRVVLRFCTINPRTTEQDIRKTVKRLEDIGNRLSFNIL